MQRWIQEELSGKIIGAGMRVLTELRPSLDNPATAGLRTRNDTTHLIFMAEPYPSYPCNPWFVRDFEKIVASLAPKDN
jgi:hypothetical protein